MHCLFCREHGTSRPGSKDEGNAEGELEKDWSDVVEEDWSDVVEEEEPEAVSTDAVENSVMTDTTNVVEEVTRDVDAAVAADVCLELRLGLPINEEAVRIEEEGDEISLRLYL